MADHPAAEQAPAPQAPAPPTPAGEPAAEVRVCSAKGCRAPARWALRWNNPKLHGPDRRKTWLACDDHRTSLGDFLGARGFLRETAELP